MTIMLIVGAKAFAQSPNYEANAFKFFHQHLLGDEKVKKKINLSTKLESIDFPHWWPDCLEGYQMPKGDSIHIEVSKRDSLDLTGWQDSKRFRVNRKGGNAYPVMFVSKAFSNKTDRFVVNTVLIYSWYGTIFRMELDSSGRVLNWCEDGWIE